MLRNLTNDVKSVTRLHCPVPQKYIRNVYHVSRNSYSRQSISHEKAKITSRVFRATYEKRHQNRHVSTSTNPSANHAKRHAAPQPPLAIVFTDIVKSTALWEKESKVMVEAMAIHDNLLRQLTDRYDGYEVKQNGDGFMIAFQTANSALHFCLDVQTQLQVQDWPSELLELRPAEPIVAKDIEAAQTANQEDVLWRGLRLRMSIHFGEPVCVWNDVIQRMDYLGPPVNRAARYVSVCEGGQVIVSDEFLHEIIRENGGTAAADGPLFEGAKMNDLDDQALDQELLNEIVGAEFEIRLLGSRHFRGVPEKQRLYFIIPKSLKGRLQYFPQHKYVQASKGNLMGNGD